MSHLVLGLSAYYHDSAAALVDGTDILAAAQEERFTRRRHDSAFPAAAVRNCLAQAGVTLDDVAAVAYYEDPNRKLSRVAATYLGAAPFAARSFLDTAPAWIGWKRRITDVIAQELATQRLGALPPIITRPHHESHAVSAFIPSPFESAAVLCLDGVGEWATTTLWNGRGTELTPLCELRFPHSLGMLYSAFTYFCGFKVDSGEYKLMGLAPYGTPRYADTITNHLIDIKPDGTFRLCMKYFEYLRGQVMVGAGFEKLFDGPRRLPEAPLTSREFDLAASVQHVLEDVVLKLANDARQRTGEVNLCLAGGVALNCVANGKIADAGIFDELWVQPAAGDAGGALGAALSVAIELGAERTATPHRDTMSGALLGPSYSEAHVQAFLDRHTYRYVRLSDEDLYARTAADLADGKVVGWFQGRMEFGPRALGNRSILGDPRNTEMQTTMNLKVKFRESFRPFAPAVLAEHAAEYFDVTQPSPYMLLVSQVAAKQLHTIAPEPDPMDRLRQVRSTIPAVTHVDGSARVQTVHVETNPRFHALLTQFHRHTGCPVLVNSSFNVRGEPIVRTPEEAYACFMRTNIDVLVLGNYLLVKDGQPEWSEDVDWREEIPLD